MKCPTPSCKSALMSEDYVEKINDRLKCGHYRVYSCSVCDREVKTFQPVGGHKETMVLAKNKIKICECGAVAVHSKSIEVINPAAPNSRPRAETLQMCDACLELEQQVRPTPQRHKAPVTWRGVYSSQ